MNLRDVMRLLLVACGVVFAGSALVSALVLLCCKSEPGVVMFGSTFRDGQPVNYPYILWGSGVVLTPEPDDWRSPPKAGDSVIVLRTGKAGVLKFGHVFWRTWLGTAGLFALGSILIISAFYVWPYRPRAVPSEAQRSEAETNAPAV